MSRSLLLAIDFGIAGNAAAFLGSGWSADEPGFVWATGSQSVLILDAPAERCDLAIRLTLRPHVNPPHVPPQSLTVQVNDQTVETFTLTGESIVEFQVPADLIARSGRILIRFLHPNAARPVTESGTETTDARLLAIAFRHCHVYQEPGRPRAVGGGRHAPEQIDLVFHDDAVMAEGVPVNFKSVASYVQVSPLVRHAEFCSLRNRFRHRRLAEIGNSPGYLVLGLYGNPAQWVGRHNEPALHTILPSIPAILDRHRGLKLLLDYSWEAGLGDNFFPLIDELLVNLGVDPARVVVLTSSCIDRAYEQHIRNKRAEASGAAVSPFAIIGLDLFLWFSAVEFGRRRCFGPADSLPTVAEVDKLSTTIRPRKILSLNRRPRWHRFVLAMMIRQLGLREASIISMPSLAYEGDWAPELRQLAFFGANMSPRLWTTLSRLRDETFASLPWVIDVDVDRSGHTSQYAYDNLGRQPYLDSYLNVVTESYFEGDPGEMKLTEKTCKAIAGLQPFVVFGHAGTLWALDRHGFERARHLDHAYDEQAEVGPRLDALNRTLAQIASWSPADVHEVYQDNLSRTLYNREHLLGMSETLGVTLWERLRAALC